MKINMAVFFFLIAFGLYANPDYALNIWIYKNDKGQIEYSTGTGKTESETITDKARKVFERDKNLAVHVIASKDVSLVDLFKLCKIIEKGGPKDIVVTVFLEDVEGFSEYQSSQIQLMKFITNDSKSDGNPPKAEEIKEDKKKLQP